MTRAKPGIALPSSRCESTLVSRMRMRPLAGVKSCPFLPVRPLTPTPWPDRAGEIGCRLATGVLLGRAGRRHRYSARDLPGRALHLECAWRGNRLRRAGIPC
jgi:hypothetical protein